MELVFGGLPLRRAAPAPAAAGRLRTRWSGCAGGGGAPAWAALAPAAAGWHGTFAPGEGPRSQGASAAAGIYHRPMAMTYRGGAGVRRAVADGLMIVGLVWFVAAYFLWAEPATRTPFVDGLAYWGVDPEAPYDQAGVGRSGSFLYTPVAALAFTVIGALPEPVFIALWAALIVGLVAWLGWPWPRIWLILLLPISRELLIGQFNVVVTAAIVAGFRWPGLWAVALLTKVTPGVGILWFAVRREWRSLAIAVGVTAGLAAASFALRPDWWADWVGLITRDQGNAAHQLPYVRYAVAAAIVVWGARTDRPWTVPLGACLALPVVYPDSFTFLLGCVAVRYTWIRRAALGDRARDAAGSGAARGLGAATGSGGGAVG